MKIVDELLKEYEKLMHVMQTAVALKMQRFPNETTPKHLRVGVNAAMVEHSALINLLIQKGIITDEEYYSEVNSMLKGEIENYRKELDLPDKVKLF
jgi:hypothetical protein